MVAAVTDPYATAAEYRARVGKSDTGDDTSITAILNAVTQLIAKDCGRFFTKDAAVVSRTYDGNRLARLYIDDVGTETGLVVKVDLDADYDYDGADETLTKDTHFWIGPANAPYGPEAGPYRYLDIVPGNGRLTVWPERARAVQVTASFGWPAVPPAIKEATILLAREMYELERSGFTLTLQNVDQAVNLSPAAFSILQNIKREYGSKGLFV